MTKIYAKKLCQTQIGQPRKFIFNAKTQPVEVMSKTGKPYYSCEFSLTDVLTSQIITEKINHYAYDKFGPLSTGSSLYAVLKTPDGFVEWSTLSGDIEDSVFKTPAKTLESTFQKKMEQQPDWDKIAMGKCIYGFMVAFIGQGKTAIEAQILAMEAYDLQEKAITEINAKNVYNVTLPVKPDASSLPF